MDIHLKETIPKVFQPIHKAVQNEGIKEVSGQGRARVWQVQLPVAGAGFAAAAPPRLPCGGAYKVAGTLRNSVYNQVVWAIDALGCTACFRCTVSPMECTYLPTGQKILFFGGMMPAS